jgi:carbonic anhydrase
MRNTLAVLTWHLLLGFASLQSGAARRWKDIPLIHDDAALDTGARLYLQQQKVFFTPQHDALDTIPQDRSPTTLAPSRTKTPTVTSMDFPTKSPTVNPTQVPTIAPTVDPYKDNEPPADPEDWYFNYDTSSPHGPGGEVSLVQSASSGLFTAHMQDNHWGQVSRPPNDYWNEFIDDGFGPWRGTLQVHEPSVNRCAMGQLQSPIDVRDNGAVCHETHQIRHLPGDFSVNGDHVRKSIESNKLRLTFERRPCGNTTLDKCSEPDPPHADFPHGWGGFADLLHIDIKVPSEHTLLNERFDAELQYFHIHPGRRRLAALSILVRATASGHNYYFQGAIDAFNEVYNKNAANCRRRLLDRRKRTANETRVLANDFVVPFSDYLTWAKSFIAEKSVKDTAWDPYHEMLLPTIHFYRYEGSLTEPPCGEFVSWWIADSPMIISFDQLDQLKQLLFTNVDQNCQRTGVQFRHSVARPIQTTNHRPVWRCTAKEFGPDP